MNIYRCIFCGGDMEVDGQFHYYCKGCGKTMPVIDGIGVFLRKPLHSLWAYAEELRDCETKVDKAGRTLNEYLGTRGEAGELKHRAESAMRGMTGNVNLMKEHCRPIFSYLGDRPPEEFTLSDWASIKTGFSSHEMLPYFYQDWFGTADFASVKKLVGAAVAEHCPDKRRVAVLGCGAGGLSYALSEDFGHTIGVDLSLPTLLLARHLVGGDKIKVYLEKADWQAVTLDPPAPPANDLEFLVANVMSLPFRDGSLSAIVTQYLMDLIGNPLDLLREMHRMLADGGVWINFSKPFRLPHDAVEFGPRKLAELAPLISAAGFEVVCARSERFVPLNLKDIYPDGDRSDQEVHFIVARKKTGVIPRDSDSRGRLDAGRHVSLELVPRIVAGRGIVLVSRKELGGRDSNEQFEIGIGPEPSVLFPADYVPVLEKLLSYVDGFHTLRQIFDGVNAGETMFGEDEFLELIRCLHVDHYVIEF